MPTMEEFLAVKARNQGPGTSRYRRFLRGLQAEEVRVWDMGEQLAGSSPDKRARKIRAIRVTLGQAAKAEGVRVQTTVEGDELWVALQ